MNSSGDQTTLVNSASPVASAQLREDAPTRPHYEEEPRSPGSSYGESLLVFVPEELKGLRPKTLHFISRLLAEAPRYPGGFVPTHRVTMRKIYGAGSVDPMLTEAEPYLEVSNAGYRTGLPGVPAAALRRRVRKPWVNMPRVPVVIAPEAPRRSWLKGGRSWVTRAVQFDASRLAAILKDPGCAHVQATQRRVTIDGDAAEALAAAPAANHKRRRNRRSRKRPGEPAIAPTGPVSREHAIRAMLERIKRGALYLHRPDPLSRLYSTIEGAPKELRPLMRIDGEPLALLDYSSFQPGMLLTLGWPGPQAEVLIDRERMQAVLLRGAFYEEINAQLPQPYTVPEQRDTLKQAYFSCAMYGWKKASPVWRAFVRAFPLCSAAIKAIHEDPTGEPLWQRFQRLEAKVVVGTVAPRLMALGVPAVTIHDAVLVPLRSVAVARETMEQAVHEVSGVRLRVKIDSFGREVPASEPAVSGVAQSPEPPAMAQDSGQVTTPVVTSSSETYAMPTTDPAELPLTRPYRLPDQPLTPTVSAWQWSRWFLEANGYTRDAISWAEWCQVIDEIKEHRAQVAADLGDRLPAALWEYAQHRAQLAPLPLAS